METFSGWVRKRDGGDVHVPEADRVVPMVAADPNGTTLRRLTHSINLEPGVLRALLDALLVAGLLTAAEENGVLVFRAPRRST